MWNQQVISKQNPSASLLFWFLFLFLFVLFLFSFSFFNRSDETRFELASSFNLDLVFSLKQTFASLFWSMFSQVSINDITVTHPSPSGGNSSLPPQPAQTPMLLWFLFVYLFILCFVVVGLIPKFMHFVLFVFVSWAGDSVPISWGGWAEFS